MLMWGVADENHNICFMEGAGCVLTLNQEMQVSMFYTTIIEHMVWIYLSTGPLTKRVKY